MAPTYFKNKQTGTYLKNSDTGYLTLASKDEFAQWQVYDNIVQGWQVIFNLKIGGAMAIDLKYTGDFNLFNKGQQWKIVDGKPGYKALQFNTDEGTYYLQWNQDTSSFESINHTDNDSANWTVE